MTHLAKKAIITCGFALTCALTLGAQKQGQARTTAKTLPEATIKNVFWQPNQLQQGSVAFFTVEMERIPLRVSATWIGKTLTFFKSEENPKVWQALAGADLETQPGSYELAVTAVLPGGRISKSVKKVDLAAANFKTGTIDVPENFVNPDDEGKKQIVKDEVLKKRAYAHITRMTLWSGNFAKPVSAPSTESFGEARILNEEKSSTHRGTDFPVKEGAAVTAANSGTVVLAADMFYEGQCVILDHGNQFFTIYMHLSKTDVKLGDKVTIGAKLGLSGATGRVTGPHLHMGVRWNGAYLDPVALLALTLPKTNAPEVKKASARTRRSR